MNIDLRLEYNYKNSDALISNHKLLSTHIGLLSSKCNFHFLISETKIAVNSWSYVSGIVPCNVIST